MRNRSLNVRPSHFQGLCEALKALPGDSSPIIRGCDCTSSVFDLSLSDEPQWVEVNTEPAGSMRREKPLGTPQSV